MTHNVKIRVGLMAGHGTPQGYNLTEWVEKVFGGTAEDLFQIFRNRCPNKVEVAPGVKLYYSCRRNALGVVEMIDCIPDDNRRWQQLRDKLIKCGWATM